MSLSSSFVFATCNTGSEPSLKAEVLRLHGVALTPAFMRPGLVTWKSREPLSPSFDLKSAFARVSGLSLGLCKSDDDVVSAARSAFGASPFHLHVFPQAVAEEGVTTQQWQRVDDRQAQALRALSAAGLHTHEHQTPRDGEWVLDLILEDENNHCLAGVHRHWKSARHPLPGALPRVTLPADSPSRAFLKIEQALAWQGLDTDGALSGLTALELGCAPGGGTYALLRRGVNVIGLDTGAMAEQVARFTGPTGARLTHLPIAVGALDSQSLPRIDLLVSDMNLAPPVVLKYVETVQRRVRAKMVLITLKLNERSFEAHLPEYLAHFARFAPGPVRATQLQANRREVCLFSRT